MIPGILLVIPMFSVIITLDWDDTLQGVVLPWVSVEIVFGTFLMRTFFETLPREYFEAARLDGANEFTLLIRIAVPLAIPAFSTLAILNLLFSWNDIIWPLVAIFDSERLPVSIGVLSFAGAIRAPITASLLPVMSSPRCRSSSSSLSHPDASWMVCLAA